MGKSVVLFAIGNKDEQNRYADIFRNEGIDVEFGLQFAFPRDVGLDHWKVDTNFTPHLKKVYDRAMDSCPDPDNAHYSYLDIEHTGFLWQTASSGLSVLEQKILIQMLSTAQRLYPTISHSYYNVPHLLRDNPIHKDPDTMAAMETTRRIVNKCDVLYPNFYPSDKILEGEEDVNAAKWQVQRMVQGIGWFTENVHNHLELIPMFWPAWEGNIDYLYKFSLMGLELANPEINKISLWANVTEDWRLNRQSYRIKQVLPYIKEWTNG